MSRYTRSMLALGLSLFALVPAPQEPSTTPQPTMANLAAWRDHILPDRSELLWETIPWKSSLSAGFAAARESGKPLLFWAMNGHPLGCT